MSTSNDQPKTEKTKTEELTLYKLNDALILIRQEKPGDRSDRDRHFAMCISELEKFIALYRGLIIFEEPINE